MKTVQEWLNIVDEDKLVDEYLESNNVVNYKNHPEETVEQVRKTTADLFRSYLRRMKTKDIEPGVGDSAFFAVPMPDESFYSLKPYTYLCEIDTLMTEDDPEEFGWPLTPPEEMLRWGIVETEYTVRNMYKVLSMILWENTFYGYEDDSNQNKLDELESQTEEDMVRYTSEELLNFLEEGLYKEDAGKFDEFGLPLPTSLTEALEFCGADERTKEYKARIEEIGREYRDYLYMRETAKARTILANPFPFINHQS